MNQQTDNMYIDDRYSDEALRKREEIREHISWFREFLTFGTSLPEHIRRRYGLEEDYQRYKKLEIQVHRMPAEPDCRGYGKEQRMKELQKLMEYGRNYQTYKPIQDEYRQIRWKGKQEKFAEARRAELTLWDAANRYLHAHLPEGVKTLPISAWEKEYTALKAQREAEYETLKDTRAEVAELQKIRKCVDIALRADQPAQTQSRTKRHEQER